MLKHPKQPTRPRTYQLDPANIEAVDRLARELDAYPSQIVNMILARGIAEIEAGRWQLGREPAIYRPVWADARDE